VKLSAALRRSFLPSALLTSRLVPYFPDECWLSIFSATSSANSFRSFVPLDGFRISITYSLLQLVLIGCHGPVGMSMRSCLVIRPFFTHLLTIVTRPFSKPSLFLHLVVRTPGSDQQTRRPAWDRNLLLGLISSAVDLTSSRTISPAFSSHFCLIIGIDSWQLFPHQHLRESMAIQTLFFSTVAFSSLIHLSPYHDFSFLMRSGISFYVCPPSIASSLGSSLDIHRQMDSLAIYHSTYPLSVTTLP